MANPTTAAIAAAKLIRRRGRASLASPGRAGGRPIAASSFRRSRRAAFVIQTIMEIRNAAPMTVTGSNESARFGIGVQPPSNAETIRPAATPAAIDQTWTTESSSVRR